MTSKRILIADDDLQFQKALTTRLESEGFEVIAGQDAYQALDLARRNVPDLMLLDISMPAGNGFSVQERIARLDDLKDIPVIYVTGLSDQSVDEQAQALGAFAVIRKPFETDHLLETIRAALGYWTANPRSAA